MDNLCSPALIYLAFSITQVSIDTAKGFYNTAMLKFWVMIIFTFLLNSLCKRGLGVISWFIIFIPFILMSVISALLLYYLGLDPKTGKLHIVEKQKEMEMLKKQNETKAVSRDKQEKHHVLPHDTKLNSNGKVSVSVHHLQN